MVIKLDRICIGILIVSLLFMLPSIQYVKFLDELGCYTFGIIALLDIGINRNFSKYRPVYVLVLFFGFFILYSIFFVHYNTAKYVLLDSIIELKPFLPFFIVFAIAPSLLDIEKSIIKIVCILNVSVCLVLLCMGYSLVEKVLSHVAYAGTCCFVCALSFLFVSLRSDGSVTKKDMLFTVAMLIIGLGCTRSKYYGEFILAIFFILLYKPGMMRNFKLQHALLIIVVLGLVVAASWSKISFYFITGNSDTFDPDVAQSYARPVLFATAGLILVDHFPFGSGLASFASYASAEHYSNLYYEYGINNVWGLSEDYNDFICDAYFPALAQFGFVGVILFVVLFSWIYSKLRLIIRANGKKYRIPFSIGVMCISFVMIESVGSTFFVQTSGMLIMILLGLTASLSRDADVVESVAITKNRKSLKIKI